eukprot:Hpha_TRINITY_DN10010_c0_g1::TRINITY_DN10010_c0_g1_i1::g.83951::m.83951
MDLDSFEVLLVHEGTQHRLHLPGAGVVGDLHAAAQRATGVLPEHQKLLLKGKASVRLALADTDTPLREAGLEPGGRVLMVGSRPQDIAAAAEAPPQPQPLPPPPQSVALSAEATRKRKAGGAAAQVSPFFGRLEILPLPRAGEALDFLTRLASDAGVVGVLEKHRWNIGALLELDPTRIALAGLNENRGQRILVRLRHPPPQHDVFVAYSDARDTLIHELTHCVHGPHNADFWALYRQLSKECRAMDWRRGGQRVGGGRLMNDIPFVEQEELPWWEATVPRRLGGGGGALVAASAAEAAGASALARAAPPAAPVVEVVGSIVGDKRRAALLRGHYTNMAERVLA